MPVRRTFSLHGSASAITGAGGSGPALATSRRTRPRGRPRSFSRASKDSQRGLSMAPSPFVGAEREVGHALLHAGGRGLVVAPLEAMAQVVGVPLELAEVAGEGVRRRREPEAELRDLVGDRLCDRDGLRRSPNRRLARRRRRRIRARQRTRSKPPSSADASRGPSLPPSTRSGRRILCDPLWCWPRKNRSGRPLARPAALHDLSGSATRPRSRTPPWSRGTPRSRSRPTRGRCPTACSRRTARRTRAVRR